MASVFVRPYATADQAAWDNLVERAINGTFLHTRRFLSYHGDRFADQSLVFADEKGRLSGILPAALDPEDSRRVVSHPGITYGGVIHDGALRGELMIAALQQAMIVYKEMGFLALRYKAVPFIYHRTPAGDDLYALFRVGANRFRCDLSATVDVPNRPPLNDRRRRDLRYARQAGVCLSEGIEHMEQFWDVLIENLSEKHGARPVHSLSEIRTLQSMFPDYIKCIVAQHEDRVVAGTVIFSTRQAQHVQYIASTHAGRSVFALDMLFDHCITQAAMETIRYFDFGTSNEQAGSILNSGLYRFKAKFGSGGVVHEFYEIPLI